tara:strand:- start:838 stop:1359 length:522 start_codon:yes stop_codon:yes gene_type:complete
MVNTINRIMPENSNKKNDNENKGTYFVNNLLNLDITQALTMKKTQENFANLTDLDNMNNSGYKSITDTKEDLGCLNNNCANLENMENEIETKTEKTENVAEKKEASTEDGEDKKESSIKILGIKLDTIITFIYLFLVAVLLFNSVFNRNTGNFIQIIVLTLLFIFYKIIISLI